MTLQERLRQFARNHRAVWGIVEARPYDEAADALDAKEKRIKVLEDALHEIIADSMCTAYAAQVAETALARAALKEGE